MRNFGTVFLIEDIENTYSEKGKSNILLKPIIDGRTFIAWTDGRRQSKVFFGEIKYNLIKKGNTYSLGRKFHFGSVTHSFDPDPEKGSTNSYVHFHPMPRGQLSYQLESGGDIPYNNGNGPSPGDYDASKINQSFQITVDDNNIYVYERNKFGEDKSFKFDKTKRFSKTQ